MHRRKLLQRIALLGIGGCALLNGAQWSLHERQPDLSYLDRNTALIAALVETILPATDSPGAKDAGVHLYIVGMVKDCASRKDKITFINGLKDVAAFSIDLFGRPFHVCSPTQQEAVLKHFEHKAESWSGLLQKMRNRFVGKPFFTLLKVYTVEGYCTSELGATKGLSYAWIPGAYTGKMPLQPAQKSWATK